MITLTPNDTEVEISYQILEDDIPEGTEVFLISSRALPSSPAYDSTGLEDCCFPELQVSIIDNDGELGSFVFQEVGGSE